MQTIMGDPDIALLVILLGALGIYAECCRPGLIAPGVAGAMLVLLGIASLARLGPPSLVLSAVAFSVFVPITAFLLSIAARARRNKLKS